MIIIDVLAALCRAALFWAGTTGRLTTIVTANGREVQSGFGNVIATAGGLAVVVSALF